MKYLVVFRCGGDHQTHTYITDLHPFEAIIKQNQMSIYGSVAYTLESWQKLTEEDAAVYEKVKDSKHLNLFTRR